MVLDFCLHKFELERLKYRHQRYGRVLKESGDRTKGEEFLMSLDLASDMVAVDA